MKFLITGAHGQLAREFIKTLQRAKGKGQRVKGKDSLPYAPCSKLIALDKESLDVSDQDAVFEAVSHHKPDVVINCAAYNFVDKAEEDSDTAFKVNATGPQNLASASKKQNALLIHFGTDYVFNGRKEDFYTEEDETDPLNTYGKSKLSGERLLQEETDNFLLFRVSWVFGEGKQNFLSKLREWAKTNRVIKVVCDQISIPTYTEDIVKFTLRSVSEGMRGVYHLTSSGYASRYEVARYFSERAGLDAFILPVGSDYFPTSARRPYFSAMSNAKLSKEIRITIPDWRDGIDRFVRRTRGNK